MDDAVGRKPVDWKGWPDGRTFAFVLTHDIEGPTGVARVKELAELEMSLGFRSSYNFIPEGSYEVPEDLRHWLEDNGFEVGVHDLRHDGKLYASRDAFRRNAERINYYLREWKATGFRSGFMLHNLDWLHDLDAEYDGSTFDIDPFEPQPDGVGTIFPFWVEAPLGVQHRFGYSSRTRSDGYLELPYSLPQDSTLFPYLQQADNHLWKDKLDWVAARGGMALVNVHPDYMNIGRIHQTSDGYSVELYKTLLEKVRDQYGETVWKALPRDVTAYVKKQYAGRGPRRPMHVGMLSYSFFERDNRVLRYAKALAERGDFISVLSLGQDSSDSPPPEDSIQKAEAGGSSDSDLNGYPRAPIDFAQGIRLYHVQSRRRDEKRASDFLKRVLNFCWKSQKLLRELHRLRRFDVIHVHNVPDFIIFSAWFPKWHGTRLILDLHDLLPEFYESKFRVGAQSLFFMALQQCERLSCRFADHVIVSNHLWMEKVAARSSDPQRTTTFVNHVDEHLFQPREFVEILDRPLLIFPGGLHPHQGVDLAIRAFAIVLKKHPQAEFHIVGDGPEKDALARLIAELKLEGRVRLFPPVPLNQVPALLSQAHVGVVPKLADGFGNEAYSTKIMEFMAAGLPVIASRTRIDEYYFGNGEVYFFKSGDELEMANAIDVVISDTTLRRRLVERGLEYSRQHGWKQKSQEYIHLVDDLVRPRLDIRNDAV
jgi:glycosyltransferase involved in cell wall biosynthesis